MLADMLRSASFDRFDIVEAWYVWLCTHHCGVVASEKSSDGRGNPRWWQSYNRVSWMPKRLGFEPRPNLEYKTLTENGQLIHDDICRRLGTCDCLQPGEKDG